MKTWRAYGLTDTDGRWADWNSSFQEKLVPLICFHHPIDDGRHYRRQRKLHVRTFVACVVFGFQALS